MDERINSNSTFSLRQLYAVLIGLLPTISIFRAPFFDFGMATLVAGVTVPFALLALFNGKKFPTAIFSVTLWVGYLIVRSTASAQTVFLLFIVFFHVCGALKGSIDIRVMRKTIETVSIVAAFFVLFQTLVYYTTHIEVKFLIKELILRDNQYYLDKITDGLYRPAAFFLEPSHYTQYCSFGVLSLLFPLDHDCDSSSVKKAIWIALGCIFTTSGMGIVLCFCIFGWFILFRKKGKGENILPTIGWILLGVIVFMLLMQMEFFRTSVGRIFDQESGHGAYWGRTLFWKVYITPMSGKDLMVGYGVANIPKDYMTGLMRIIYCYGYVGVVLTALMELLLALYGKRNFTICCCIIYSGLMVVANLTGFLSYIFYFGLISSSALYDYRIRKGEMNDPVLCVPDKS